jgi:long-chain acyl-CoA synthetase
LVYPRLVLGVPILSTLNYNLAAGPILSTQFYDFQIFPDDTSNSHRGCPVINDEVKLVGVDEQGMEAGEDPVGELSVRGPSLVGGGLGDAVPEGVWKNTGWKATVRSNGTVKVLF